MTDAHLASSALAQPTENRERLPYGALLALATAAGLLPQMSAGLNVSQALIGQLVTLYAVGSMLAAIPLTIATRSWRRKPLLLTAIAGFAVANSITAVSELYWLTLGARFIAGIFAGLLWALLAGYASRMVASHLQGRAITVAMLGAPLALSLGIPAGTLLGTMVGWQLSFAIMTALTIVLVIWVHIRVPDFAGEP
jgi:predicted MFS family arabinose efflux permease